jgi:hypothetical protein
VFLQEFNDTICLYGGERERDAATHKEERKEEGNKHSFDAISFLQ